MRQRRLRVLSYIALTVLAVATVVVVYLAVGR